MKKINIGLIGLGAIGKVHLHNALNLQNIKLVGVADSSKNELKYAYKMGVDKTYDNYQDLLNNPKIDAVIISTPNFLHYECAVLAAEKGKDILIEKPLARNFEEGKIILSSVKKNGVNLLVGYPMRFSNTYSKIKEQLEDGLFGKIFLASATNISSGPFQSRNDDSGPVPVPNWWFDPKLTGGGALLDLGCHLINLLKWFFGDVIDVKSYLGYRYNMDFEDYALCLMKFKNGPIATVKVGWISKAAKNQLDLYGTVKHITKTSRERNIMNYFTDATKKIFRKIEKPPLYKELEYFTNSILSDVTPHPSCEEGLLDLEIISKAYKNALPLSEKNEVFF